MTLIGCSTSYSILWAIISLLAYKGQGSQQQCEIICSGSMNSDLVYSQYTLVIGAGFVVVVGPCICIIIVSSIWSYVIFKKAYIGGDNELNRRMLSLPILVLLPIQLSSFLSTLFRISLFEIFDRNIMEYSANWLIFAVQMSSIQINNGGPLYPLVLAYFNPQLRAAWKQMLKKVVITIYRKCAKRSLAQIQPSQ